MPRKRQLTDLDLKMIELAKQYKERQEKGEPISLYFSPIIAGDMKN